MKIRVYYEDTDCGNVVYYANYLKFMERGRTELLREKGISLVQYRDHGMQFVVVEAHQRFRASAHYDDLLDIQSCIGEITGVSMSITSAIYNQHGQLLVTGEVKLACVNNEGRLMRIPDEFGRKLGESNLV